MASVIDYYGDNQDTIIPNAGPGHWNDPDMVNNFIATKRCTIKQEMSYKRNFASYKLIKDTMHLKIVILMTDQKEYS